MKSIKPVVQLLVFCSMLVVLSLNVFAQSLVPVFDLGTNGSGVAIAPVPGPLDITNFNSAADVQNPDGFNYFIDNGGGLNSPGQTFTAPSSGTVLTSVSILMGGNNGGGGLGPQTYYLNIFSVSGTTSTLVANYISTNTFSFLPNDWLTWTNLSVPLTANGIYAYTLSRGSAGVGWCQVYLGAGNTYTNGQAVEIQAAGGASSVTYGTSGLYDGNFDLGIIPLTLPVATPPVIQASNPNYGGSPVTISEVAGGVPPLYYQWLTDNGTGGALVSISGATSTNVVVSPSLAGTYKYAVIVTNNSGSVTSSVSSLAVLAPSAPLLTQDISPSTNVYAFANGSVTLSAAFNGTLPIGYQWLANTNGSYLNVGVTNNVLTLSNLQASASGSYELTANNTVGNSNSSAATLNVLADPPAPTSAVAYPYAVFTNNPLAYWRLNETNDTIFSSMQAYDYSGHNLNATYGNGSADNLPGPSSPSFSGFEANNTAAAFINAAVGSHITVPPLNLNTNTVTITAWINPSTAIGTYWGLLMWRGNNNDAAGLSFGGNVQGGVAELGYAWNNNSPNTYNYHSGLYAPLGQWSFVALTITPTNTTFYLYYVSGGTTNLLKSVQVITNSPESFSGGTTYLGGDPGGGDGRDFNGSMDEVAVFAQALSETQIQSLFEQSLGVNGIAPAVAVQPANLSGFAGQSYAFTAGGGGAPSPTYQWQSSPDGVSWSNLSDVGRISGSATSSLTITNTLPADAIYYRVVLSNINGTANSSAATLTLTPIPSNGQWTVNFAVNNTDNGNLGIVYSGRGILGTGTFWNAYNAYDGSTGTGTYRDDGVTASGISLAMANQTGEWCYSPLHPILLLQPYASCGTNAFPGPNATTATFGNVPNGTYNLALYGVDGGYLDRGVTFTVNGTSQTLVNVQDKSFAPNDNTALFTGVTVTNGQLVVGLVAANSPAHTPNNEGEFNGGQLQLIQASGNPSSITGVKASGGNLVITGTSLDAGASYRILSTTNIATPVLNWIPVATNTFAGGAFTNSIPMNPTMPASFYRVVEP